MSEPSGPQWCARYPTSISIDDLVGDFRDRVRSFLSVLKHAGAVVEISATFRPPERAYLMHWCCMIADSGQDPASVSGLPGVDVAWLHSSGGAPDIAASRGAARAMKENYRIAFPAALVSRHTQRRAIDMTIGWNGTLKVRDFDGRLHAIASLPHDGSNPELIGIGRSFGVFKLVSDPPHWSDDGH